MYTLEDIQKPDGASIGAGCVQYLKDTIQKQFTTTN